MSDMSDRENSFHARLQQLDETGRRKLLGELEVIRQALEDGPAESRVDADGIPVLRDVVNQEAQAASASQQSSGTGVGQGFFNARRMINRLLGEKWSRERKRMLSDALRDRNQLGTPLDPYERRQQENAFRRKLHQALEERMELLLGEAMDDLRVAIIELTRQELQGLIQECFAEPETGAANADDGPVSKGSRAGTGNQGAQTPRSPTQAQLRRVRKNPGNKNPPPAND